MSEEQKDSATRESNREITQNQMLRAENKALRAERDRLRANLINCSERLAAYYGDNYPAVVDARAALTPAGGGQNGKVG